MVARRPNAELQVSWTDAGAGFWGWDGGRSVPADRVRRLAGEVLGSWWATRVADTGSGVVALPGHDPLYVSMLTADPRSVVDLMADRYPTRRWTPSVRWLHACVALAVDAAVTGLILPSLETTGLRWRARWEMLDHPAIEARLERLTETMPPVVVAAGSADARVIIDLLADAACRRSLGNTGWKPPLTRSRATPVVAVRRVTTGLTDDTGIVPCETPRHEATFATLSAAMAEVRTTAEGSVPLGSRGRLEPAPPGEPADPSPEAGSRAISR
ncbi:MAG: hypothetical protein ACC660_03435, partial [Acidimicrobiales bacterium]